MRHCGTRASARHGHHCDRVQGHHSDRAQGHHCDRSVNTATGRQYSYSGVNSAPLAGVCTCTWAASCAGGNSKHRTLPSRRVLRHSTVDKNESPTALRRWHTGSWHFVPT